ncbi:hypothetical protein FJY68_12945 [candidate division WOR-3 bacterium]|uniref:Uncharacterized protein n=1 Tax=candidate division WOR-3 bacterium TaxID=2052148 RepID=A0A937XIP0_UNCW3|nr:hypothetical protein [candidate division WOR-3 bacterium]
MQDPVKRRENWELKYNLDRVKQTLEEKRAKMAEHYQTAVAGMVASEIQVREALNIRGVSTIHYVPYLNFGRQLYKLTTQRQISGESAVIEAQVLLEKWARRGLDPDVLGYVRTQVFNIAAPPAP